MNLPRDILSELNPAQKEAVQVIKGHVLILAGPGSGNPLKHFPALIGRG
ncbi:MAG: hypothetical protein NTX46_05465 [Chloroflexi bacterium]|nr:hypothetical protein [Chloroflexota bacterium]